MSKLDLRHAKDGEYVDLAHVAVQGSAPGLRSLALKEGEHGRYLTVFAEGDEILSGLTRFGKEIPFGFASFTAIGAGKDFKLAWYSLDKKAYRVIDVPDPVEILTLEGNIGRDTKGEHVIHCHVTLGTEDGRVLGGHLLQGFVEPTLEMVLDLSPAKPLKQFNERIGLAMYTLP